MHAANILLVDDDDHKRELIARSVLAKHPDVVLRQCSSGTEAIDYLRTTNADAMVTDHNMTPINGIQLIDWVRRRFPRLPILMITGNPEVEADAIKAGANSVISSFRFSDVGDILAKLIHDEGAHGELA